MMYENQKLKEENFTLKEPIEKTYKLAKHMFVQQSIDIDTR